MRKLQKNQSNIIEIYTNYLLNFENLIKDSKIIQ